MRDMLVSLNPAGMYLIQARGHLSLKNLSRLRWRLLLLVLLLVLVLLVLLLLLLLVPPLLMLVDELCFVKKGGQSLRTPLVLC